MKKRDKTIDNLRGLAMIWVIVIHVLYWGNFFENNYVNLLKSFLLFEMPLFFFVTGASNSFNKNDGYFKFVLKRYKRILIPYWIFAFICAILSTIYLELSDGIDIFTSIKILISWLIPINRQITPISYLTWALWFIPVYLIVVLIIPILKYMKESRYSKPFIIVLVMIFSITSIFKMGWIQNVTFYIFWIYIGLFYKDIILKINQNNFRKQLKIIALIGSLALSILFMLSYPKDMQYNKFPPNIIFAIFSIITMSLILLALPYINKLYNHVESHIRVCKIIDLFSSRSMTIFLYQVFAFNLTIRFTNFVLPDTGLVLSIVKSFLCFITTLPLCVILAFICGKAEQININRKI